MTPPEEAPTSVDDRLRDELRRYVAPVQPSPELRASVERLTRHSRVSTWTRWRGPLVGAAAVAAIAVLTSVVLINRTPDARPGVGSGVGSVASPQPFAPEPRPSPELDDDPPIAVTYSEGAHGTRRMSSESSAKPPRTLCATTATRHWRSCRIRPPSSRTPSPD